MLGQASGSEERFAGSRRKSRVEVLRQTWRGFMADDCLNVAAQMSFFFALSIFPFLLVVASIVGWLPFTNLWQTFAQWIITYLPMDSRHLLFSTILDLTRGYKSFFSLGVLGMVWSSSAGFVSLMQGLSKAHGVPETRSIWKKYGIALIATFVAALFFIVSFAVLTLGHWMRMALSSSLASAGILHFPWAILRFALTLLLMCLGFDLIDHFLPDTRRPWRWFPASSIIVSLTFVVATEGMNLYVRHNASISKVYGAIAGFIVFLLWIYIANLILLGAAEAEKAVRIVHGEGAPA
jgi:membrane protein